jgi:hypothetical protein
VTRRLLLQRREAEEEREFKEWTEAQRRAAMTRPAALVAASAAPTIAPTVPLESANTCVGTTSCRAMPKTLAPKVANATAIAR